MWMPAPQAPVGCPPGLEYLTQIDQILVHQQIELFESETEGRVCVGVCAYVCACVCVCVCIHSHICDVGGMHARVHSLHLSLSPPVLSGWETANKYQIKNSLGQQVYFAAEGKRLLQRDPQSCNTLQPYLQNTVIYIEPSHLPCDTYVGVPCVCVCVQIPTAACVSTVVLPVRLIWPLWTTPTGRSSTSSVRSAVPALCVAFAVCSKFRLSRRLALSSAMSSKSE